MEAISAAPELGVETLRQEEVLSKAVVRAADHLGVSSAMLGRAIGLSEASVSRLRAQRYRLARNTKPFELAQLFVRMFRGLDAITGSDDTSSRSWMRSANTALGAKPIDLVQTIMGLMAVIAYVDSRRARV